MVDARVDASELSAMLGRGVRLAGVGAPSVEVSDTLAAFLALGRGGIVDEDASHCAAGLVRLGGIVIEKSA